MTKPRRPKPETTQAAPWTAKAKGGKTFPGSPRVPLNQSKQAASRGPQRENPPVAHSSGQDSPAKPYPKPKPRPTSTKPHNQASITLLEKLGLRFEKMIQLSDHGGESKLFAASAPHAASRIAAK